LAATIERHCWPEEIRVKTPKFLVPEFAILSQHLERGVILDGITLLVDELSLELQNKLK
jgi:hypothetical protein